MTPPQPGEIARLVRFVATGAVVATLAVIVATAGERPWQAVASVVMIGLLPYVAFVALANWARGVVAAEVAVLAGLVLAVFFAVGLYGLAFLVDPNDKSASAALAVPLFQSIGVAVAGAGAALFRWRARQASGR